MRSSAIYYIDALQADDISSYVPLFYMFSLPLMTFLFIEGVNFTRPPGRFKKEVCSPPQSAPHDNANSYRDTPLPSSICYFSRKRHDDAMMPLLAIDLSMNHAAGQNYEYDDFPLHFAMPHA